MRALCIGFRIDSELLMPDIIQGCPLVDLKRPENTLNLPALHQTGPQNSLRLFMLVSICVQIWSLRHLLGPGLDQKDIN